MSKLGRNRMKIALPFMLSLCVCVGIGHAQTYPAYLGQYPSGIHCNGTYSGTGPTTLTCNYQTVCKIQAAPNDPPYYETFYANAGIVIGTTVSGQPAACHVNVTASTGDGTVSEVVNYQNIPGVEAIAQASWYYFNYYTAIEYDLVYCNGDENFSGFVPEPC